MLKNKCIVTGFFALFTSYKVLFYILQNLLRFDESVEEEASGVHNAMGILESLLELRAKKVASIVVQTEGAVAWLLNRVRAKPTAALPTANKLYGACVCISRDVFKLL